VHIGVLENGMPVRLASGPNYSTGKPPPKPKRHPLVESGADWQQYGIEPRWIRGLDSSACAAAIDPCEYYGRGAEEWERFLQGARQRGETALVIATLVSHGKSAIPGGAEVSVRLPGDAGSVTGTRLPPGANPQLAPDLHPADKDLALRLSNMPDVTWRALTLGGKTVYHGGGGRSEYIEPEGSLQPLLVDPLGAPLAAVWTPPGGAQRWYIVPESGQLHGVLDWLVRQGLPAFVPGALRRARSPLAADPDLQTRAEAAARTALTALEATYNEQKARLNEQLKQAEAMAEPMRHALLYGTAGELADAVAGVLTAAGLDVVDLDHELGTRSADLLVTGEGRRLLVEVKSERGGAKESLVADLYRHLDTWPQLRPDQPVDGGVLVVNHEHKKDPRERSAAVYTRPEFVGSLTVAVLGSLQLFDWWRADDWSAIRRAMLTAPGQAADVPDAAVRPPSPRPKRRWLRGE